MDFAGTGSAPPDASYCWLVRGPEREGERRGKRNRNKASLESATQSFGIPSHETGSGVANLP